MEIREAARAAVDAVWETQQRFAHPQQAERLRRKASRYQACMSAAAMTSGNVTVNPRKTEQTDIEAIYSGAI